jgi:hypothetical protein
MALVHSPQIATNGLVFYYDMTNTKKSWFGKPTTNFYTNGHFSNGTGIVQESGSNATNTVIFFPYNPGNSEYVLEQSGGPSTEYQINLSSQLLPNTTYVLSGWYGESIDYVGESRMFHCRAFSSSGANVALGNGIGTVIETRFINGITWKYCFDIITTPSDYSNDFNWYLGYGGGSYTGKRYYTNIQMEQGSYPNRFVNGTRSSTQAIVDLTNQTAVTATSLTYNSDNTFSFNGPNYLTLPFNSSAFTFNSGQTIILWMTNKSTSAVRRNPYNQAYAGGGTITHENDTGFNYYYGTDGTDGSTYSSIYSSFNLIAGERAMIALTRNTSTVSWYKNGVFSNSTSNPYGNVVTGTNNILIGSGYTTGFMGEIHAAQLYNRALTRAEIAQNYNALAERFFGYQTMTYIATGNMTLTNNGTQEVTMFKTSDNNSWNGEVRSTEMFTAPCTIEFSKNADGADNGASYAMIGWNTDPTSDSSYTSIDHASYPYTRNDYHMYNNGSGLNGLGTWESSKRFYVVYDTDGYIRHYNDSKLLYSANYGTGNKVYFDSSFYSVNSTYGGFSNVRVSRRSWNGYTYV